MISLSLSLSCDLFQLEMASCFCKGCTKMGKQVLFAGTWHAERTLDTKLRCMWSVMRFSLHATLKSVYNLYVLHNCQGKISSWAHTKCHGESNQVDAVAMNHSVYKFKSYQAIRSTDMVFGASQFHLRIASKWFRCRRSLHADGMGKYA